MKERENRLYLFLLPCLQLRLRSVSWDKRADEEEEEEEEWACYRYGEANDCGDGVKY